MSRNLNSFCKSRRIYSLAAFTATYWFTLSQMRKSDNEIVRMAAAGSLMVNIAEMTFYPMDTINSSSKVC
jgi:hypothetical protein